VNAGNWIAIAVAGISLLMSAFQLVFRDGKRTAELEEARKEIVYLRQSIVDHSAENEADMREANQVMEELRDLIGAVKEFSREQSAVNVAVTRTLDLLTGRLEKVGDLTMQNAAILGLHTEVLRRKGLVEG
jgi:methyl-accepting chemotaxis protein